MMMETRVCIIGAGPAGLIAAIFSAQAGANTTAIEVNSAAGKKLLLTGGGRCNLTHLAAAQEIARAFGSKGRFLSYSLHKFPPAEMRQFFQKYGLKSTVEDDGCVFPATNRSDDVRDVLFAEAKKLGVHFIFSAKARGIIKHNNFFDVHIAKGIIQAEKIIIATGGKSFPETGSTGDGYKFAQSFGHTIIPPRPSLVPLVTGEKWPGELGGTSLENVKITTMINNKKVIATGAMLFTQDGIGGPAAIDLSQFVTDILPNEKNPCKITIDLIRDTSESELEQMILRQASEHPKKTIVNVLSEIVPRRISQVLCRQLNLPENLLANQLNKNLRMKLMHLLKAVSLSIVRTRPIEEAIVTRGGVSTGEVEPKTMESKICPHLFFAGEVLDVDGPCGGYSLQMCWSTGALAGISAGQTTPSNPQ
jgi:predicted Rossmann fold flavoprotein